MHDQADKLRELAGAATATSCDAAGRVPMVVVSGAKADVGATTVTVNLAAVLTDWGARIAVVDAAPHANNLADVAGVGREIEYSVSDVVAGDCSAVEALAASPAGMRVLANRGRGRIRAGGSEISRNSPTYGENSRRDRQRLLDGLESLDGEVDALVVDAGYGLTPWSRRLWAQAGLVVLVTTADDASILATYTALKLAAADSIQPEVRVVVNQCDNDATADDVHGRIQHACRRFLSLAVEALPALPRVDDDCFAGKRCGPRVWEMPNSAFGRAALWLGRGVSEVLAERIQGTGYRGQGFDLNPRVPHPASSIL